MIFIDLKINNESDHSLAGPEAILQQIVTYTGDGQQQKVQQFVVAQALEPRQVADESSRSIQMSLQIPDTAVPTINNCKYISIHYQLYLHCDRNKLEMLCPLVIG